MLDGICDVSHLSVLLEFSMAFLPVAVRPLAQF